MISTWHTALDRSFKNTSTNEHKYQHVSIKSTTCSKFAHDIDLKSVWRHKRWRNFGGASLVCFFLLGAITIAPTTAEKTRYLRRTGTKRHKVDDAAGAADETVKIGPVFAPPVDVSISPEMTTRNYVQTITKINPYAGDLTLHGSTDNYDYKVFNDSLYGMEFPMPDINIPMEKRVIFNFLFDLDIYSFKCFQLSIGSYGVDGEAYENDRTRYKVNMWASDISLKCTGRWHYELSGGGSGTGSLDADIAISSFSALYDLTSKDFRTQSPDSSVIAACTTNGITSVSIKGTGLGLFAPMFKSKINSALTDSMQEQICGLAENIDTTTGPTEVITLLMQYF